jgi:putative FmdB family regulatory protein
VPIYEYRCSSCGHRFEKIQKSSGSRPAPCPKCGGAAKRLVSAPAIQFKGTGWYITDYARKGKSQPETDKGGEQRGEEKSGGEEKSRATEKAEAGPKDGAEAKGKDGKTGKEKAPAKEAAPSKESRGKRRH